MEFATLRQRALEVRRRYAIREKKLYGRAWTDEEITLGLVGDVGDLMMLIQARNGVREIPNAEANLAHELADCLWSIMVLSGEYGVDLEKAFMRTMDDIEARLGAA